RIDSQHVEKRIAGQPAGATGRQKYGGIGEIKRSRYEAVHQLAFTQSAYQRRQERGRRRDGEHARCHGRNTVSGRLTPPFRASRRWWGEGNGIVVRECSRSNTR